MVLFSLSTFNKKLWFYFSLNIRCLTHTLTVNGTNVRTKTEIHVLGILFDSKLKWGPQVQRALQKAEKALNALRLIRRYFVQEELVKLITSNCYELIQWLRVIFILAWLLSRFWREPISLLFCVNIPSIILKPDKYNKTTIQYYT